MRQQYPTRNTPSIVLIITSLFLVFILAPAAWAHNPIQDTSALIAGLIHPWLIPAHIIAIIVLGLLIGQQRFLTLKSAIPIILITLLIGAVASLITPLSYISIALLTMCLTVGLIIAISYPLPRWILLPVFLVTLLLIGIDSTAGKNPQTKEWDYIAGTIISTLAGISILAFVTDKLTKPWMLIGLRIIGSWSVTIAILILVFVIQGGQTNNSHGFSSIDETKSNKKPHRYRSSGSSSSGLLPVE